MKLFQRKPHYPQLKRHDGQTVNVFPAPLTIRISGHEPIEVADGGEITLTTAIGSYLIRVADE
jgi:hypothetical protein